MSEPATTDRVSLRHLGRFRGAEPLAAVAKEQGVWQLADGERLLDLSGGPLVQTLAEVPPPPPELFARVSAPGGVETPERRRLEERVLERSGPACGGVLWGTSGSDALESCLWAVEQWIRQRHETAPGTAAHGTDPSAAPTVYAVRPGGYHGNTAWTRALTTRGSRDPAAEGVGSGLLVLEGFGSAPVEGLLERLTAAAEAGPVVVVLETVPTTGDPFWPGPEPYRALLRWARDQGAAVILDEVASGAFRHGWFSAFEWAEEGAAPAAVALSKGLTCGVVPLACALLRRDVAEALRPAGKVPGFTLGLTDPAAWVADRCLDRFEAFFASPEAGERRRALERLEARAAGRSGLSLEITPTTARLAFADRTAAEGFRQGLGRRGLVTYENALLRRGERWPAFFLCPPLDLPADRLATAWRSVEEALEEASEEASEGPA